MAYCGLKSRAIYYFIPLTCNFAEVQCWQKISWRIRTTVLRLNACIFLIHNGKARSKIWTSEVVGKI